MLDHRAFLNEKEQTFAGLESRGVEPEVLSELAKLIEARRKLIQKVEAWRHELNEASAAVQQKARAGDQAAVEEARGKLKGLKADIKKAEEGQNQNAEAIETSLMMVPNLPDATVPVGADESQNVVERVVGAAPSFDFAPKPHWDIGEALGILDFEAAAKMSGARFVVYRGAGARLERALMSFMLDQARDNGYLEIMPPLLVRLQAMQDAAQYPKFEGESFETLDREYALIPTAEVPLVGLHRDEILDESTLPRRYAAFTPCFRREAGAAGKDTRGLIRLHQFNKVELVTLTTPESSFDELERLTGNATSILEKLGLHFRVVSLCTGDLGFGAAKTYDLEVWMPGQDRFREISSCSNCTDFQARRANIRFRPQSEGKKKAKPRLLHTLNGSALAVGRTVVALLENGQQADGSVKLPEVLASYFGATEIR